MFEEEQYRFKEKYEIKYCDLCHTYRILCPYCLNISCNGSGCAKCFKDFDEFNNLNVSPHDYLNDKEETIIKKFIFIKKHLPTFLSKGKSFDYKTSKELGEVSKDIESIFENTES